MRIILKIKERKRSNMKMSLPIKWRCDNVGTKSGKSIFHACSPYCALHANFQFAQVIICDCALNPPPRLPCSIFELSCGRWALLSLRHYCSLFVCLFWFGICGTSLISPSRFSRPLIDRTWNLFFYSWIYEARIFIFGYHLVLPVAQLAASI